MSDRPEQSQEQGRGQSQSQGQGQGQGQDQGQSSGPNPNPKPKPKPNPGPGQGEGRGRGEGRERQWHQGHDQMHDQRLRRLLDDSLRELPHRSAPATLETRVLGELQRRAAQSWWRRSFAHWPWPARTALVVLCLGFIGFALLGDDWTATALGSLRPSALALFPARQARGLVSVVSSLVSLPPRLISPLLLYSALAAGAALYVTLFGLGAAAYRTLYLKPLGR